MVSVKESGLLVPRSDHLNLVLHFLDFCFLLFQSFVLPPGAPLPISALCALFDKPGVFLQELIEQHCVHRS